MELNFYATVFIHVNFFTGGADNHGCLASPNERPWRHTRRTERRRMWNALELIRVIKGFRRGFQRTVVIRSLNRRMADRSQNVALIEIAPVMVPEIEAIAGSESRA